MRFAYLEKKLEMENCNGDYMTMSWRKKNTADAPNASVQFIQQMQ